MDPFWQEKNKRCKNLSIQNLGNNIYVVEAEYNGNASLHVKWIFTSGSPAKLEYSYIQTTAADFYGITFNIDETKLKGMKWLGAGPYRVWKNRLKGAPLNVWQKKYNQAITGEVISYPEFSGYHGNCIGYLLKHHYLLLLFIRMGMICLYRC